MKGKLYSLAVFILFSISSYAESKIEDFLPCPDQPVKQAKRSQELKVLFDEDAQDRDFDQTSPPEDRIEKMMKNDLVRRMRVGEIFGEGCFSKAEDYAHAAMIYQHGDVSDHYYQAFLWAKQAVDLGDKNQLNLVAMAADRYLVSIGHKQLFGSQYSAKAPDYCYCIESVEPSFPEALRIQYTHLTLNDRYAKLDELNNGKQCVMNAICDRELLPSEKGVMPWVW